MSDRQLIIAVGREFGSAGHLIAERLAEHFSLQLYDKNFLEEILKDKGIDNDKIHQYDEKHKVNPTVFCLEEDTNPAKWLFDISDLEVIEMMGGTEVINEPIEVIE